MSANIQRLGVLILTLCVTALVGCRSNHKVERAQCAKVIERATECGATGNSDIETVVKEIDDWCDSVGYIKYVYEDDWNALHEADCDSFSNDWLNVRYSKAGSIEWGASPF